ncbi:hypothetical protein FQN57_006442 [Myotisia sp. PD_48]|nr:hypothetical protein FQN57_006442 [Myotisia sp. PD_48]
MPPRGTRKEPSREVKISKELSYVLRHAAEREKIQIDKQGYVNVEHLLQYRKLKGLNVTLEDILDAVLTSDKQRFGLLYSPNQLTPSERDTKESVAIAGDEGGVNAPSDTTNSVHPTATQQALAANDPDPRHYMIRARQGHSMKLIEMESLLQKLTPSENSSDLLPETVVHGTYHATWPKILESGGLRCMGRTHIHFASGPPLSSVLLRSKVDGESEVAREAKGQKEPEGVISGMRGDAQILIYIDIKRAQAAGCPFWISENGVILSEGMPTDDKQDGMVPTEFFDVVVERKNGLGILWENGALAQPVPDWMICAKVPQGKGPRKNKGGKAASRLQLEGQLDPVYP